jgi:8-oxo-dGTP pyrophosphatase MutT (NUDIX family)
MNNKELSVGIILTDGYSILGCRPFGKRDKKGCYDLPKGHHEQGETFLETAIREMAEETGFEVWKDANLIDLGQYDYIPTKDLYLYLLAVDCLPDPLDLHCKSTFKYHGKDVPEVLGYKHIPVEELDWFFEPLSLVINQALTTFNKST